MEKFQVTFLAAGTPNMMYYILENSKGTYVVSRSIDMSREDASYPNGTGPWKVGEYTAQQIQKMAVEDGWQLQDGRNVGDFPDFREIPKILKKEFAKEWAEKTGSKTSEKKFTGAAAVALVADAFSVFDITPWDDCHGNRGALHRALQKEIVLTYDDRRGVTKNWKEAVEKYGLHLEPVTTKGIKILRQQAEDNLRKDSHKLPDRLSALLTGANYNSINSLHLPTE
ncbi:hypothetical protein KAU19_04415 [Candidatus Parcubacteria bacterium]|nr:hypothetical protein [Candidatus Parcubacteria bacterium]